MQEEEKFPETIGEAVDFVLSQLEEDDIKTLRETPRDDLMMYHYGFGIWIRNELGLWGGNDALLKACCPSHDDFIHPDSASIVIIEAIWDRLQSDKKE